MGVDLRLLPYYDNDTEFSHCILPLERRRDLWTYIEEVEKEYGVPVSERFTSFCGQTSNSKETGYGKTTVSSYGYAIRWVYAKYLKPFCELKEVEDNYVNRAAWAYLLACPDYLKIALFWH